LKPERKREREHKVGEVLKFPKQCPLVLLVMVCLREGEALGKKKGVNPQGKKLCRGFTAHDRN
jgi:hypothetical protein